MNRTATNCIKNVGSIRYSIKSSTYSISLKLNSISIEIFCHLFLASFSILFLTCYSSSSASGTFLFFFSFFSQLLFSPNFVRSFSPFSIFVHFEIITGMTEWMSDWLTHWLTSSVRIGNFHSRTIVNLFFFYKICVWNFIYFPLLIGDEIFPVLKNKNCFNLSAF